MTSEKDVILLADDDENDIALFERAFKQADIKNPLQIVRNGEEAIAYLAGEGKFADRARFPLPTLLLLDLRMPRKSGFQVLQWVRQHPTLRGLRILVLTVSSDIRDVNMAYELGANSFIVKSLDIQTFLELVSQIKHCWLSMSLAPKIE
jgi:CheY-like chemotaxis protein